MILSIDSPKNIRAKRFSGNPLLKLNGLRGSWDESVFCPGYLRLDELHYLFPSTSTYSLDYPYKSNIGVVCDTSPYFQNPSCKDVLIDGPKEKKLILPNIQSEIVFDSPCPIIVGDNLYLYYSIMDRADNIWKEALTIFPILKKTLKSKR